MTGRTRSTASGRRARLVLAGGLTVLVIAAISWQALDTGGPIEAPAAQQVRAAARPASDSIAAQLRALIPAGIEVSVSAVAPASGARVDYGPTSGMIEASDSKLDLLECLLLAHEDAHTPINYQTDALAIQMIEQSDNQAGQQLWNGLGSSSAMTACNARLGLKNTINDPYGYYGLSTSAARDQLALLENLVAAHGPLDVPSQQYALNLMRHIERDEAWGVSAAADAGTTSAVKNGWLAVDTDGDRWEINSDGIITVDSRQILISIFTAHEPDEQTGIALVESIARTVTASMTRPN